MEGVPFGERKFQIALKIAGKFTIELDLLYLFGG
jgi:hypothetical protein